MEVRGGGQAFEDRRTAKEHDYESDDDEKDSKRHRGSQSSPRHAPAESKVGALDSIGSDTTLYHVLVFASYGLAECKVVA